MKGILAALAPLVLLGCAAPSSDSSGASGTPAVQLSDLQSKGKKLSAAETRTLLTSAKTIEGISTDSGQPYCHAGERERNLLRNDISRVRVFGKVEHERKGPGLLHG